MAEKFDQEVIDLRNVQADPEPPPSPEPSVNNRSKSGLMMKALSLRQMFLVMGCAVVILGVFLYVTLWLGRPNVKAEIYRPFCPGGQRLPQGQVCPQAAVVTK